MHLNLSPVQDFLARAQQPGFDLVAQMRAALSRANGNRSRNTYIVLDPAWTLAEAVRQQQRFAAQESKPALYGLPVSLKDCFDLEGFVTSSGSKFYAEHNRPASADSAIAARLRRRGAIITGKTHLHQLAYGITGENRDYGNCLQPADPALLTGGSSSGAVASIQEGSALAAIGTDTGGSVRVPAALCGLSGYRSSLGVADWRGGAHLAPVFDTIGWLFRDLRDAPLLAEALFDLPPQTRQEREEIVIGVLDGPLLEDCDSAALRSFRAWQERLVEFGGKDSMPKVRLEPFVPAFWLDAREIYAPLQAAEAAQQHAGFYAHFEPIIAERLAWGASLREDEIRGFALRHQAFCTAMAALFDRFDFLLAPATPVSRLDAGRDQSEARARILRHTTPASLAGLPSVVLPSSDSGLQLLAAHNDDRRLLRFAARAGERLAAEGS
ncbi:amidase [Paracidobacterium acidisoli]|uniref:Amidase n=1 Tax=Paracidobacterium acidisoli TaxID=2303751 RepID=A0A372IU26_9BACT|nr:amidase [Paracidobacterium acidisoli]MBT9329881.1 amidase [Paracidobacterium acidisoli]